MECNAVTPVWPAAVSGMGGSLRCGLGCCCQQTPVTGRREPWADPPAGVPVTQGRLASASDVCWRAAR